MQRFRLSSTLASLVCAMTFLSCAFLVADSGAQEQTWYERKSEWHGFEQLHFQVSERSAYVVVPDKPLDGNPWIWRARFPGYHAEMDESLVGLGFHLAYIDVAGMFGSPQAMSIGDSFYEFVTSKLNLSERPALEGVSRGGLFVYNWAARHPDRVSCIYCDTPVCDFKSWPGGFGSGLGSTQAWQQCLNAYGLNEEEAESFLGVPLDHAEVIANERIPLLHIVAENDQVVPPSENTYQLQKLLEEHDHTMEVISVEEGTERSNGHHFDHPNPQRVVEFITRHASSISDDRLKLIAESERILFLGDSITYAGHYVAFFDAWLNTIDLDHTPIVIDAGLPSETVSGLSEDGHAGGRFPRPDLHERLDRVLEATQPDLVFACYGINCGIYQPFDDQRFQRYKDGILRLKEKVEAHGAELVLITPPFYDDSRRPRDFSYNAVLDHYANWLIEEFSDSGHVVDLHHQMADSILERREEDPEFTVQPDAVHPNTEGHWMMATALVRWFGDDEAANAMDAAAMIQSSGIAPEALDIIRERINVRRDAYLSAAGHKRPGIREGLPIDQAEMRAAELTKQLHD